MIEQRHMMNCIYALNTLQITGEQIDKEMIRKEYHRLCRQFHPDQYETASEQTKMEMNQKYIQVQRAYDYLNLYQIDEVKKCVEEYKLSMIRKNIGSTQRGTKVSSPHTAKIFTSNKEAARLHKLQKEYAYDKKKANNKVKNSANIKRNTIKTNDTYEETLKKISAIWIAEVIHKQIEEDKRNKERENKNKLYKAFMKYHQNEMENEESK